jgi:hypothetical protein
MPSVGDNSISRSYLSIRLPVSNLLLALLVSLVVSQSCAPAHAETSQSVTVVNNGLAGGDDVKAYLKDRTLHVEVRYKKGIGRAKIDVATSFDKLPRHARVTFINFKRLENFTAGSGVRKFDTNITGDGKKRKFTLDLPPAVVDSVGSGLEISWVDAYRS